MICDRKNESVGVHGVATWRHGTVRVDSSDAKPSRGARRKRSTRFAFLMTIPTSWFFPSSWYQQRECAAAVHI
jgi:hypothetical protein